MNNARRKAIAEIADSLSSILSQISSCITDLDDIAGEEEMAYDNLPDGLKYSSKGEAMEEAIYKIQDYSSDLDSIQDDLRNLRDEIQDFSF